jgi:hypothetical protein
LPKKPINRVNHFEVKMVRFAVRRARRRRKRVEKNGRQHARILV